MGTETQISAVISRTTKEALEKHARATGRKKGYVIEMALLHHLQAMQDVPTDVVVPARIVVSVRSLNEIAVRMETSKPTADLRALMKPGGD